MKDFNYMMGYTYRDSIKDFEGVCTGVCYYLTGCTQALITPRTDKEPQWLDVQRLIHVESKGKVGFDNSSSPGADVQAPIR